MVPVRPTPSQLLIIAIVLFIESLFPSCTHIQVSTQSLSLTGPMTLPPLHIQPSGDSSTIHISPWFSYHPGQNRLGQIGTHTLVNQNGVYEVDSVLISGKKALIELPGVNKYTFEGKNFVWKLPYVDLGANLEIKLKNHGAMLLGGNYSKTNNGAFWSAYLGSIASLETQGFRLQGETGIGLHSMEHYVEYVENQSTGSEFIRVQTFQDEGKMNLIYFFFGSTIIIGSNEDKVSFFLQAAINWQSLFTVDQLRTDSSGHFEVSQGMYYTSLSPGIGIKLSDNAKLVLALRFVRDFEVKSTNSLFVIIPHAQVNFAL